jgi:hypothetical protein
VLLLSLAACAHRRPASIADVRFLVPVDSVPTDSVMLAKLARQHPCVTRVPRLGRHSETFSRRVNCTLVETATAAIRNFEAPPELIPELRPFRIERVRCLTVHGEAARSEVTHEIEVARWTIDFNSDEQPSVGVSIDRLTGEARAYAVPLAGDFGVIDPCD